MRVISDAGFIAGRSHGCEENLPEGNILIPCTLCLILNSHIYLLKKSIKHKRRFIFFTASSLAYWFHEFIFFSIEKKTLHTMSL